MNSLSHHNSIRGLLVFLFFITSFWLPCSGVQPSNDSICHREITIFGGIWNLASIDEEYSFQKYSGHNLFGGISFGHISSKNRHFLSLQYANITRKPNTYVAPEGLIEHRYKELKSMMIDFNYSFQRRIFQGRTTIYAAINWMNHINYSLNEDDPEVFLSSIAPGFAFAFKEKKHSIGLDIAIPVVSLALRDPYHISQPQTDEYNELEYLVDNLKIQSFGKLRVFCGQINYRYQLSRRVLFGAGYQFRYISYEEPRPLRSVSGVYSTGFTYIF